MTPARDPVTGRARGDRLNARRVHRKSDEVHSLHFPRIRQEMWRSRVDPPESHLPFSDLIRIGLRPFVNPQLVDSVRFCTDNQSQRDEFKTESDRHPSLHCSHPFLEVLLAHGACTCSATLQQNMSGVLKVVRATGLLRAVSHAPGTQVSLTHHSTRPRASTRSRTPILA